MSDKLNETCGFDLLGDVLETLRFKGSMFFRSELAAPWGMSLANSGIPRFHIALGGDFVLGVDNNESINVQATDIAVLPNGAAHWVADQHGRELVPINTAVEACELDNPFFKQGKITNNIMCGLIKFDQSVAHPIFNSLPALLHFPCINPDSAIWMTITFIEKELIRAQKLRNPIIDRLTEVLFLQLLNHYISENQETVGFLAALGDRRMHRAFNLIHQHPGFDWTLASLGEQIGMSKATLVRHFQDSIGISPMAYITNWRMIKARNLLKYSSETLEHIAEMVGFSSARTLSKAFQRHYGYTPKKLRQKQHE